MTALAHAETGDYLFMKSYAQKTPARICLSSEYSSEIWTPGLLSVVPSGIDGFMYKLWWLMHHCRQFSNRDYRILVIRRAQQLVHRSLITPGYFRFPFMGPSDLQIGDTWTDPEYRGKGLAKYAIQEILNQDPQAGRAYWYVVERNNTPSIRAAERIGFAVVGEGVRTSRFGVRPLGAYEITRPRQSGT